MWFYSDSFKMPPSLPDASILLTQASLLQSSGVEAIVVRYLQRRRATVNKRLSKWEDDDDDGK